MIEQLVEDAEDLVTVELVAKRLARPAFLDAVQAREVAFVGDLPGDVQRRAEVLRRSRGRGDRRGGAQSTTNPFSRRSAMKRGDFALDGPVGVVKAVLQFRGDLTLVAAAFDGADHGRRGGAQREDLLGARLEQDAAELLLTELNVLGKVHAVARSRA